MIDLRKQFRHCISVDCETTGLDPEEHGLFEVGLATIEDKPLVTQYTCVLRESAKVDGGAMEINGRTEEEIRRYEEGKHETEYGLLKAVLGICTSLNRRVIIGKNPRFDYGFLLRIWERNGNPRKEFPLSYRVIDWGGLALPYLLRRRFSIPERGFSSDELTRILELPEESRPHTGINGALHNLKCIEKIVSLYNND